jgi:RNA polymerase primary sigma factor
MTNTLGNYQKDPNGRSDSKKIRINVPLKFTKKWEAIPFVEGLIIACYGYGGSGMEMYLLNHFLLMDLDDINYIIGAYFQGLNRREFSILIMRFSNEMTLREVAMILDIGSERVRQIEATALRKLRHPVRSTHVKKLLLPEELYALEKYDSLDEIEKVEWITEKLKEYETAKEIQMRKEIK